MAGRVIPIACAINGEYAVPLIVMLSSLRQHLDPSFQAVLYLVHQGLSADFLGIVSSIVETHSIIPSPTSTTAISGDSHFPPEAAFVLLLPQYLPGELDRVLFLDADLLVLDDLAKLWEVELGNRTLAAATDAAIPRCGSPRGVKGREDLGIPGDAPYFNAGVMLVGLRPWREREVSRRALEYLLRVGPDADFLHQEALNATLWNDWLPLDSRWNLLASLAGRSYSRSSADQCQSPGIIHFAGRFKPWKSPVGGPFAERYQEFLKRAGTLVALEDPTRKSKLLSLYDRRWRPYLYGCERALWERRLL